MFSRKEALRLGRAFKTQWPGCCENAVVVVMVAMVVPKGGGDRQWIDVWYLLMVDLLLPAPLEGWARVGRV